MISFERFASRLAGWWMGLYLGGLATAAASLAFILALSGYRLGSLWVLAGLAVVAAVAERGSVRFSSTMELSISLFPTVFAAVLFGPLSAMFVAAASMAGDFRRPYMKWSVYTCTRAITGAAAGLVAANTSGLATNRLAAILIASTLATLTAETLDLALALLTFRVRGSRQTADAIRTLGPVVAASIPLYAPVVALLAFSFEEVSTWTLPLFFAPALVAQRSFVLYQEQRRLTDDLVSANTRLEKANLSFATALVATLDARDRYTAGHSAAVAIYARDIAARLGLSENQQQLVHLCGLVHDIGKVGLPASLLEKPGPLTLEERRQMETHSAIGERILAKVDDYAEIAKIVRHHHERVDGQGYPDGLSGDGIPLLSKIIAVGDAYNAMTSDRPYRDAMPSRVARLRLAQAVESQFDTRVVAALQAILAGASDTYRAGSRSDFNLETQDQYSETEGVAEVA